MGSRLSKSGDTFVLLCRGDLEVCVLGVFSNLNEAKKYAEMIGSGRPLWIEKFQVDDPCFYEDEADYIVWKN